MKSRKTRAKEPTFFLPPSLSQMQRADLEQHIAKEIGAERLIAVLSRMLLIRHFEVRAESAYLQGKIGGFFHSYQGQEAIQSALLTAIGPNHWFTDFYRCHALALLLGATPNELMAELYGKATGNVQGRGGSMHFYTPRMLGGFGIVGGQMPIAAGAAFSLKYLKKKGEVAVCFLGEGAVAQGTFHETLNLAALWELPCIYIIENNQWGMGTHVSRALAVEGLAEHFAPAYDIKGYTLNGMDFFNCYAGFQYIYQELLKTGRPALVECHCERFKGHSISDPALYRSKEELQQNMQHDPIPLLASLLQRLNILSASAFEELDKARKKEVLEAMDFAEKSPLPSLATLEQGVFAS